MKCKDYSPQLQCKSFEECGKIVNLMLQRSKNMEYWEGSEKDCGFSVSKGILAMREKRVFDQSMVKPGGQGWSVLILGEYIDEYS